MVDVTQLKLIHIISSTVLFGTGLGTAFHGLATNLRGDLRAIVSGNRNVVLADWIFTTPAVIVQPVTGVALALEEGWPLTSNWILASVALYIFVGACWLPVVWLQMRMARIAKPVSKPASRCRGSIVVISGGGSRWAGPPSSPCSSFSG